MKKRPLGEKAVADEAHFESGLHTAAYRIEAFDVKFSDTRRAMCVGFLMRIKDDQMSGKALGPLWANSGRNQIAWYWQLGRADGQIDQNRLRCAVWVSESFSLRKNVKTEQWVPHKLKAAPPATAATEMQEEGRRGRGGASRQNGEGSGRWRQPHIFVLLAAAPSHEEPRGSKRNRETKSV